MMKKNCVEVNEVIDSIIDQLETHPQFYPITLDDISGYTALALNENKFPKCSEAELQRFHDVFMYATIHRFNTMKRSEKRVFKKGFEDRYKNLLNKSNTELNKEIKEMNAKVRKEGEGWQFGGKIEDIYSG